MVSDAESHVSDDRAKREVIDLRNQGDQLAYQTEKQLVEFKDKMSSEDETELRRSLEELKEALKQDEKERIRGAIEKHNSVWQRVAQKMYESASQPGAGAPGEEPPRQQEPPRPQGGNGGAVDAEYEVLDDDGKKKN
jgi:molecular chaperone DnaK